MITWPHACVKLSTSACFDTLTVSAAVCPTVVNSFIANVPFSIPTLRELSLGPQPNLLHRRHTGECLSCRRPEQRCCLGLQTMSCRPGPPCHNPVTKIFLGLFMAYFLGRCCDRVPTMVRGWANCRSACTAPPRPERRPCARQPSRWLRRRTRPRAARAAVDAACDVRRP